MTKTFPTSTVLVALLTVGGCRQEMADQPRYEPLEASRFFADGMSARPLRPGVAPRGELRDDDPFYLGTTSEAPPGDAPSLEQAEGYVEEFPIPITLAAMRRGQERYNIYCAPCHDASGGGAGPVVEHGFPRAESFHSDRLRQAPPGYLFDVITRGYKKMPSYARQVDPEDRWAIVAYLRALQFSRHAELNQLPETVRERFTRP